MPVHLYSNENFDQRVVLALRALGYDVLTSLAAGRANQRIPDEAVLDFAKSEGRAVITFNRLHFLRLHQTSGGQHAGIIVCSMDHQIEALAKRIDDSIQGAGTIAGQVLRVNRPAR